MNILILTSVYPQADDEKNSGVTPVVKYFAKEWVKAGHKVIVVHNPGIYPSFINILPIKIQKKINSKFGIVIPQKEQRRKIVSRDDNVICYRIPLLKIIPKTMYSRWQINKQFKYILKILRKEKFKPDVVLGHWESPQIPLLSLLKKNLGSKTAIVFHGLVYIKQNRYKKRMIKWIRDIDVIGARSKAIAYEVKEILDLEKKPFICYSGIPDKYFDENIYKKIEFDEKTPNSYLYVGRLIKRKNIDSSLIALRKLYKNDTKDFTFNIVGEGAELINLRDLSYSLGINDNIKFLGYKEREEIIKLMGKTEVFIMISDNETFGLVYIEAMARGCIVIASRKGGIDGIIKHGENGFLCEQGNAEELYSICDVINKMSLDEKKFISNNAIKTASKFKDSMVAKKYLDNIIKQ